VVRWISATVSSVLAQTYRELEVVVVDDGSTDGTADVLSGFGDTITVIRQTNQGVSVARNAGAAAGRGSFVAFLDGDDAWLPAKLEVQVAGLDRAPDAVASFVGSFGVEEPTGRRREIRYRTEDDMVLGLAFGPIVGNASSVAIRRAAFDAAGGFDPMLSQSADWDMWLRLAALGPLVYDDTPLVRIRMRPRSMSSDVALLERDTLRVLAKFFDSPAGRQRRHLRARVYASHYLTLGASYISAGRPGRGARYLIRALRTHPGSLGRLAAAPVRRMFRRSV
jgi:glycosyltransferase involved in cell wall biosynthesis